LRSKEEGAGFEVGTSSILIDQNSRLSQIAQRRNKSGGSLGMDAAIYWSEMLAMDHEKLHGQPAQRRHLQGRQLLSPTIEE
jgi:hypothetical protein